MVKQFEAGVAWVVGSPCPLRDRIVFLLEKSALNVSVLRPEEIDLETDPAAPGHVQWAGSMPLRRLVFISYPHGAPITSNPAEFDAAIAETLGAFWTVATAGAAVMQTTGGGSITVVYPAGREILGNRLSTVFGEGIRALAASLAVAYVENGRVVRVNSVPATEAAFEGDPRAIQRVASIAEFLSSDASSYMTAHAVDGGG